MLWVAATYERAGEPFEPTLRREFESPASAAVGAPRRDRAARTSTPSTPPRRGSRSTRATDDVMALARSHRSTASPRPGTRASTSSISPHRGRQPCRARRCSGRWPARSRALPELRIEWITRTAIEARGADAAALRRRARATRRASVCPGSDFIFPTVHQVDAGGQARDADRRVVAAGPRRRRRRHPARRRHVDAPGRSDLRAVRLVALPDAAAVGARHHALARATRLRRPRSPRPTSSRSAPRRAAATSTWVGRRSAPGLPSATRIDADPRTAAGAVFHASDEELGRDRPRARGASREPRRRAPREVHARLLRRGRARSVATPPLPRGRRVPRRLVVRTGSDSARAVAGQSVSLDRRSRRTPACRPRPRTRPCPPPTRPAPCIAPSGTSECGR